MIGDTPQPGETPRTEGDPWSFADPDPAWWRGDTERSASDAPTGRPRHPRRRAPQQPQAAMAAGGTGTLEPPRERTAEELEGYAAGVQDADEQLSSPPFEVPAVEVPPVEVPAVERDHNRPDPHRYDPLRPPAGYRSRLAPVEPAPEAEPAPEPEQAAIPETATQQPAPETVTQQPAPETVTQQPVLETATRQPAPETVTQQPASETVRRQPEPETTAPEPTAEAPDAPDAERATPEPKADEPDVMVLPEPDDRSRPTVALDQGPAPVPLPTVRPRQAGNAPEPIVNRVTEPVVVHRPTEPLPPLTGSPITDARLEQLENSPFWQDGHEDAITSDRLSRTAPRRIASHRGKPRRRPLSAQVTMITLGLVAAFFAWVSAEPFWLAVGHGDSGYATTTTCTGDSVTQRCTGRFAAADGSFMIRKVTLLGVEEAGRDPGSTSPARMVSPDSRQAYLGGTGWMLQLRWLLGFALVLVCGYGIAGATGARRLEGRRERRAAVLLSLAGPLALLLGFLIAAY